jgi:hypothetical protein
MVSVLDPAVLLTVAWLVVLFVAVWRYRWGDLPPTRALLVVAAGLLWLAYSLTQLAALLTPPYDDFLVAVSGLTLLVGLSLGWRWWRTR